MKQFRRKNKFRESARGMKIESNEGTLGMGNWRDVAYLAAKMVNWRLVLTKTPQKAKPVVNELEEKIETLWLGFSLQGTLGQTGPTGSDGSDPTGLGGVDSTGLKTTEKRWSRKPGKRKQRKLRVWWWQVPLLQPTGHGCKEEQISCSSFMKELIYHSSDMKELVYRLPPSVLLTYFPNKKSLEK